MGKHLNLVGSVFGSLTVVSFKGTTDDRMIRLWNCSCSCGGSITVPTKRLRNGMTKSCGCLKSEVLRKRNTTHGKSGITLYPVWEAMLSRCNNPNNHAYPRYGGRGIKICERWLKFENFLEDMGLRPEGKTIDRHPNTNGDYEPGNCRWATYVEQNNNRRDNVLVSLSDGDVVSFTAAARRLKLSRYKLGKLLAKGELQGVSYAPLGSIQKGGL